MEGWLGWSLEHPESWDLLLSSPQLIHCNSWGAGNDRILAYYLPLVALSKSDESPNGFFVMFFFVKEKYREKQSKPQ